MLTLYGIPNCGSCRAARRWLQAADIEYSFHDLRADGLDSALLKRLAAKTSWEALVNKRSRTWKDLPAARKQAIDQQRAIALMLANPTLVKRPVLDDGNKVLVGFSADDYQALLAGT